MPPPVVCCCICWQVRQIDSVAVKGSNQPLGRFCYDFDQAARSEVTFLAATGAQHLTPPPFPHVHTVSAICSQVRQIDCVTVKGSNQPLGLFCYDLDLAAAQSELAMLAAAGAGGAFGSSSSNSGGVSAASSAARMSSRASAARGTQAAAAAGAAEAGQQEGSTNTAGG